jgi:hypothetical protein
LIHRSDKAFEYPKVGGDRADIKESIGCFANFMNGKPLSALKTSRKETPAIVANIS